MRLLSCIDKQEAWVSQVVFIRRLSTPHTVQSFTAADVTRTKDLSKCISRHFFLGKFHCKFNIKNTSIWLGTCNMKASEAEQQGKADDNYRNLT